MHRIKAAKAVPWLLLGLSFCVPFLMSLTEAQTPAKGKITALYDLYIGFVGRGTCEPLNVQFKQLSIEAVFRNLQFKFEPVTYRRKTYDWTLAGEKGWSNLLMPIPGIWGPGEITDHDLCPFWNLREDVEPHRLEKATLEHVAPQTKANILAVDRGRIPLIKKKILTIVPNLPSDGHEMPVVPVAPKYVFEFSSNIEPGQTKITLEGSDAVYRIDDLEFYADIPAEALLVGKDVSQEYSFRHPQVNQPGTLTVRYIPAKKRP